MPTLSDTPAARRTRRAARPIGYVVVRVLLRLLMVCWVLLKWMSMKRLVDDRGLIEDALSRFVPHGAPTSVGLVGNIAISERAPLTVVLDEGGSVTAHGIGPAEGSRTNIAISERAPLAGVVDDGGGSATAHGLGPTGGSRTNIAISERAPLAGVVGGGGGSVTAHGLGPAEGSRTNVMMRSQTSSSQPADPHAGCAHPRFLIKVYAYNRRASLDRLLRSLSNADYNGDNVTLEFFVDGGAPRYVTDHIHSFRWSHGPPPRITQRKDRVGLMNNIVESWDPAEDEVCDFAIMLEDDTEVSPHFYYYAKSLLVHSDYRSDADLVGISLYTPKWNEIKYPNVVFKVPTSDRLFLMQLPCSWGALYFPWHWRDFRRYFDERRKFENGGGLDVGVNVPPLPENARSNSWERSWKRYYIEYMFYRGLVMLYPNFREQNGLSTTHRERGEHTGRKVAKANKARSDKLTKVTKTERARYIQTLVAFRSELDRELNFTNPPRLKGMKVVNLFHRASSREEIKAHGTITSFGKKAENTRKEYLDKVHGKRFCAFDVYGQREPPSNGKKYFLYDPQNGLTNQIQQLQGGVVIARELGRILVVPPVIADDGTLLDPSDVFDLSSLPVSWVHYHNYDSASLMSRLVDRKQRKRFLAGSQEDFFRELGIDTDAGGGRWSKPIMRLDYDSIWEKKNLADHEVRALFGGCPDTTLAITNIFLLLSTSELEKDDPKFVRLPEWSRIVKMAAKIREEILRNSVIPSLKGEHNSNVGGSVKMYSCLHLRRGDFAEFCSHIQRKKRSGDPAPYDSRFYRPFKYENCFMDPAEVSRLLASRMQPGEVLYIATNEKNRTIIEEGFNRIRWRTSTDFSWEEGAIDPRLLPALDQAFCEGSRVLYYNRWSSFSKHMMKRRTAQSLESLPSLEVGLGDLEFR